MPEEEEEGLNSDTLFNELCEFAANDSELFVKFPRNLTESANKFFGALFTYMSDLEKPEGLVTQMTLGKEVLRVGFVSQFPQLESNLLSDDAKFRKFTEIMQSFTTALFPFVPVAYATVPEMLLDLNEVRIIGMSGGSGSECMRKFADKYHEFVTNIRTYEIENPDNNYYWC